MKERGIKERAWWAGDWWEIKGNPEHAARSWGAGRLLSLKTNQPFLSATGSGLENGFLCPIRQPTRVWEGKLEVLIFAFLCLLKCLLFYTLYLL